jgi:ADP-ribosylglycohydrolase
MDDQERHKDRIKGTIIAGACGDAFGMPYEGLKKHQMKEYYGKLTAGYCDSEYSYHTKGLKKGSYTDDTQLTLATIEAILAFDYDEEVASHWGELSHHFSNRILAEKIGRYFVKLYKNKELIGAGRATKLALKEALKGTSPVHSGLKDGYGCRAAMRISPIALLPLEEMSDQGRTVLELTSMVVQITHNSTVGLNSAFLVSSMIKHLLMIKNQ